MDGRFERTGQYAAITHPGRTAWRFQFEATSSLRRLRRSSSESSEASLLCRHCGTVVDGRQLRLTREDMQAAPPDVLFTSVEMLKVMQY